MLFSAFNDFYRVHPMSPVIGRAYIARRNNRRNWMELQTSNYLSAFLDSSCGAGQEADASRSFNRWICLLAGARYVQTRELYDVPTSTPEWPVVWRSISTVVCQHNRTKAPVFNVSNCSVVFQYLKHRCEGIIDVCCDKWLRCNEPSAS